MFESIIATDLPNKIFFSGEKCVLTRRSEFCSIEKIKIQSKCGTPTMIMFDFSWRKSDRVPYLVNTSISCFKYCDDRFFMSSSSGFDGSEKSAKSLLPNWFLLGFVI